MSKPIIGLNADFLNAAGDKPAFTYVSTGYYDAISKTGGIHHDLELRIESAAHYAGPNGDALPPGFDAAFAEGRAAATR